MIYLTIKYALLGLFTLSTLANILYIGKERKPITPGNASVIVLVNTATIIWLYIHLP